MLISVCVCVCVQGKEDEAMVLTSTTPSRVDHVTSELASQLYTSMGASYSDSTQLQQVVGCTSPPRKKTRAEKEGHSPAVNSTITGGSCITPDPVCLSSNNPDLLSYRVSNSRSLSEAPLSKG